MSGMTIYDEDATQSERVRRNAVLYRYIFVVRDDGGDDVV